MRLLSLPWKTSVVLFEAVRSFDTKTLEMWMLTAYVKWWPVVARLFQ